MKLLIGIPTGGSPVQPFLDAIGALRMPATVTSADRSIWSGNFVAAQREMLLREAVDGGYDLLAMVDDDIVPPPDALERLVAALDDDPRTALVGALYYSRDGLRPMAVDDWDPSDTTSAAIPPYRSEGTSEVAGVGFGCSVLRVSAIRNLTRPYVRAHIYVDPNSRRVTQCDEDYLLCDRLRRTRSHVRLHGGVRCAHYDRETRRTYPEMWESDAQTDRRRMIVEDGGGVRLVPFDGTLARAEERHERVDVELLFSARLAPAGDAR